MPVSSSTTGGQQCLKLYQLVYGAVFTLQLLRRPLSMCFSSSTAVSAHQLLFQLVSCCFNPSAIVSARQLQPFWWLDMRHLQLIKRLRLFTPTDCCGKSLRHVTDCCGKSLRHVTDCCGKTLRHVTDCLYVCLSTVPALFVRVPLHGACSVCTCTCPRCLLCVCSICAIVMQTIY